MYSSNFRPNTTARTKRSGIVLVIGISSVLVFFLILQLDLRPKLTSRGDHWDGLPASLPNFGNIPLGFEVNKGQSDSYADFIARGDGYNLFLAPHNVELSLQSRARIATISDDYPTNAYASVSMQLLNANPQATAIGVDLLPGKTNYFLGNDPHLWEIGIPTFASVMYENIYPGIDVVYYGNQRQLEYDFIIAPGVNPDAIQLKFEGIDQIKIDDHGNLILNTNGNQVIQNAPIIFQEIDNIPHAIEGSYLLDAKDIVRFTIGDYDSSLPLIIDPIVSYATFLGGDQSDNASDIVADSQGNAYIIGFTPSLDFPISTTIQADFGGGVYPGDVFVTKLNADGSAILFSTYLGGSGPDAGASIALDSNEDIYLTGYTGSDDFPTLNPAYSTRAGDLDIFISKIDSAGAAIIYSTYLGGSSFDVARDIDVDSANNAFIVGDTTSTDLPTINPTQSTNGGNLDAFVARIAASGSTFLYTTYLGGTQKEEGFGIAVDNSNNVYVTGGTFSTIDFPITPGAYMTVHSGYPFIEAWSDAFVTKLNTTTAAMEYSTFLGGATTAAGTYGDAIAINSSGNAFVTGYTGSAVYTTTLGAYQTTFGGGSFFGDGYVTKLNPDGSGLVYSTYLGGDGSDRSRAIYVDDSGYAYLVGETTSSNFPTVNPIQASYGGNIDAFITQLSDSGSELAFSSYLGGSDAEEGYGVYVDASGMVYATGQVRSSDFPVVNALQPTYGGGTTDAFVIKLFPGLPTSITDLQIDKTSEDNVLLLMLVVFSIVAVALTTIGVRVFRHRE